MSVNSFVSVSGVVYNIEESALSTDQTGTGFISAVSSISNMLVGVLFDYDNNDLGTLTAYDPTQSTKGVVFINGYLGASGYTFSSPDHFDVNDVLPSQVPLLDEVADIFGLGRGVLQHGRQLAAPVLEYDLRHLHRAGGAEFHPQRSACRPSIPTSPIVPAP